MRIYIASDHGGFETKRFLVDHIKSLGVEVIDLGPTIFDSKDDYPDFAKLVGEKIDLESDALGILLCRSGQGMCMVVNKYKNVRAFVGFNDKVTIITKQNDWANCLCIPTDYLSLSEIKQITETFIKTKNTEIERHVRRIQKI